MKEQVSMMRSACWVLTSCPRWERRRSDATGRFCRSRPSSFEALSSDWALGEPLGCGWLSGVVMFGWERGKIGWYVSRSSTFSRVRYEDHSGLIKMLSHTCGICNYEYQLDLGLDLEQTALLEGSTWCKYIPKVPNVLQGRFTVFFSQMT